MKLELTPGFRPPTADDRAPAALVELDVDELALAFVQNPRDIARLLVAHASNVLALDLAAVDESTPQHECAIRAALADGTRAALLADIGARPALAAHHRTNGITA
ncbi:hypothetical protein AB0L80_02570 [Streptomyces sp. NPDC052069]|uniref:hypothetical protein n=1 Tax=Streptomyces sp. NPDC052069 TaxID=3154650 RepID=UPI00343DFC30